jgi:outer membrane protein
MKKRYLVLVFALAVSAIPTSSSAFEIGARGYYWFPSLDGNIKVDEGGVIGTNIDFEDDLGLDDDEFPTVEVFVGAGKHHLSLAFTDVDYSNSKTITRSINFDGQNYSALSSVSSSIEYQMIDLHYQYDLVDLENILAGFSVGGVFHVKYLDGEVSLKTTGIDEKEDFTLPIPMIGLNLHLGILADLLEARVRGTGIAYSDNYMYELLGEVSWTPFPFVDIHGGYKTFTTNLDEDDVDFDYDMSGPYVALTISF